MTNLTLEVAREWFDYNPETGVLRWKKTSSNRAKSGSVAGSMTSNGYLAVRYAEGRTGAHRVCFLLGNGYLPAFIDHIDNCRTNNKLANLRPATITENLRNSIKRADNTSGIKGVSWDASRARWFAYVGYTGKRVGRYFKKIEEATEWVEFIREELHGAFANHGKLEVQL